MTAPVQRLRDALAGRYEIEREIGQGGMATVYLAQDVRHDRKVAVKVLRPELSAILGADRFLKEIRTTANLQHPHILPLHDSGTADGTVFYVMPFVQGESLRQRIVRDKQLPVAEAVRIACEVASALDYAHRHGVVHRDIKPENILLHDGQALVADFGIALAVSSAGGGTRMTETGMSLGTPHYMSPEQAMGEREITARSDVYALGCVLYEMLVGEPPFTGPTAQAIIARVVTEEPRSLRLQRKTIPENVEDAVETALSKIPADRFSSAAQFAEALGRSDYAQPTARAATRRPPRTTTTRAKVLGAVPWALAAIGLAWGGWEWMNRPEQPVTRSRIMLWQTSTPATLVGRLIALSPDGRTIAFADTVGGQQQLWLKEPHLLDAVLVSGTSGAVSPVFSPDGQWIAFGDGSRLKKVPRLGGSPIILSDSIAPIPTTAWTDNGTILFTTPSQDLLAVSADGGPTRRVFSLDSTSRGVLSVTALPGGDAAIIGTCRPGCEDAELRSLNLETLETRFLAGEALQGWFVDGHVVFIRRDGGVFRAPFDRADLEFTAAPAPVLNGVRTGLTVPDMTVSRNGTLAYIPGAAQAGTAVQPVWVSRSGNVSPVDSSWSFIAAANWGMSISPDGTRLAVGSRISGKDDIWIKDLKSGVLRRLTFEGYSTRAAGWTPDGKSVLYTSVRQGMADILMRRADGTGAEEVLVDIPRAALEVALTPDPAQVIVRTAQPPSRDILLYRKGGTTVPLVASTQFQEAWPMLSRDGRWLAYGSDESGRYEVYVRPFPDVNGGKWQISRNGGTEPYWAHNGRELFYRESGTNLMAVAIQAGATFSTGEHRVLFPLRGLRLLPQGRAYDEMPDGRFVFTRPVGASADDRPLPVVVVENWAAELRRAGRRP